MTMEDSREMRPHLDYYSLPGSRLPPDITFNALYQGAPLGIQPSEVPLSCLQRSLGPP